MGSTKTQNPFTGEIVKEFDTWTEDQIKDAFKRSWEAFQSYKDTKIEERIDKLKNLMNLLKDNKEKYAKLITLEMGKTITESTAEIDRCAGYVEFYCENAHDFLKNDQVKSPAEQSYVVNQPLGPLLFVQPWNFPFWLPFKAMIPQILVGNTVLVKNASNTPQCGMELEKLFSEAGFEEGVYQYAPIASDDLEIAISNGYCRGASLTGSTQAGKSIAKLCGENVKKCVLELGGADPFIVLDDADLSRAAELAVQSRLINNAQACTNAKRFIIHEKVYDEFKEKVIQQLEQVKVGDPNDEETKLGPLAKESSVTGLQDQIKNCLDKGAKIGYGDEEQISKKVDPSQGFFFKPIILEDIPKECEAYKEELFGPVFSFFKVKDDEEAVALANDSQYGLGGAVHSADLQRAEKVALQVETGMMNVNDITRGYGELPFGGVKNSGFGREGGFEGCRQFVNIKTVTLTE